MSKNLYKEIKIREILPIRKGRDNYICCLKEKLTELGYDTSFYGFIFEKNDGHIPVGDIRTIEEGKIVLYNTDKSKKLKGILDKEDIPSRFSKSL